MTEAEWGYLGGIIDGEGCLMISIGPQQLQAVVTVTNCDEKIIERVSTLLGKTGTPHRVSQNRSWMRKEPTWRPTWVVTVGGGAGPTADLLRGLMPHLVGKRPQAEILLRFCVRTVAHNYRFRQTRLGRGKSRYGPVDIADINAMRRLNFRGSTNDMTGFPELVSLKPTVWRGNGVLCRNFRDAVRSFKANGAAIESAGDRVDDRRPAASPTDQLPLSDRLDPPVAARRKNSATR